MSRNFRLLWEKCTIRSCLATEFSGVWGSEPNYCGPNAYVLRSTNIDDHGHIDFSRAAGRLVPEAELATRRLKCGDVLLETSGGGPGKPVGRVAHFDAADSTPYITSNFFRTLRPDHRRIDSRFLAWQLLMLHREPSIWNFQQQTTGIINLKVQDYLAHQIFLPNKSEQLTIVATLDAVDGMIAQTEAVIAKLEQLRAGLFHDLLTRGLDKHGERRDPIAHPEQFQDSLLGRIPKDWNILSLEQLLARVPHPLRSGPFGSGLLKRELKTTGIPLLGIDNVRVERFDHNFSRFVDEEKFAELSRYAVRPRDLMITVMGTVGRCCVVPDEIGNALSSKHVWTISLDLDRYSPSLACWQINHAPWMLRQLRRDEQGGVMSAIRSETLRGLLFPVPGPEELRAIETALHRSADTIASEENELKKQYLLKTGLMSDLLTGRVRVLADLLDTRT